MKLSEAIRLGATMKPQAFGAERRDDGSTCARGAACDAIGLNTWFDGPREWLDLCYGGDMIDCPVCGQSLLLGSMIAYCLNDAHHWTREQIADFVELHEGVPEPQVITDTEAVGV